MPKAVITAELCPCSTRTFAGDVTLVVPLMLMQLILAEAELPKNIVVDAAACVAVLIDARHLTCYLLNQKVAEVVED